MSVLVDTNVLLYSANPESPEHASAHASLERLRRSGSPWFLTWGVVYEFVRVSTHAKIFPHPMPLSSALRFIRRLLESPSVGILRETEAHLATLDELAAQTPGISGNDVHDAHIVALMREHGVATIWTADRGFRRFQGLEVIEPVRP